MMSALKRGDGQALAESVMLQGILAGDVTSAAIATKLRLQNENLRLKRRMNMQRLRLESIKTRLLAKALEPKPEVPPQQLIRALEEIYGLTTIIEAKALPAPDEGTAIEEHPEGTAIEEHPA